MTESILLFLLAQSLIIIGSILTAYVKTKVDIAELRLLTEQTLMRVQGLKIDHEALGKKVDGISRNVGILEGMERARQPRGVN